VASVQSERNWKADKWVDQFRISWKDGSPLFLFEILVSQCR